MPDLDPLTVLRAAIAADPYHNSVGAWAKDHRFAASFIYNVLAGRAPPSPRLLAAIEMEWRAVPKQTQPTRKP